MSPTMWTLTPDVSGPISVTQFAQHVAAVLRAVREEGQVVPIAMSHEVVAVLWPVPPTAEGGGAEVDLDVTTVVTTSTLEGEGPSRWVEHAAAGCRFAITYRGTTFAILAPLEDWPGLATF